MDSFFHARGANGDEGARRDNNAIRIARVTVTVAVNGLVGAVKVGGYARRRDNDNARN